jgi:hypothetical protein
MSNLNLQNDESESAPMIALESDFDIQEYMYSKPFDINIQDNQGETLMHILFKTQGVDYRIY